MAAAASAENIIPINDVFATSLDPSNGKSDWIYQLPSDSRKDLDEGLLPVGASQAPQGTSFVNRIYSCVMDVTALPEDTRGTGDDPLDQQDSMQLLAETLESVVNQGQSLVSGINTSYKNARKHSLSRIKSKDDLWRFQTKLSRGKDKFYRNQKSRFREVLLEFYFNETAVSRYCDFGQLPRLSFASFELFKDLIDHAVGQSHRFVCEPWEGCMAQSILSHWGDKLREIRVGSRTYRQHLIKTYVTLRDAKFAKFVDGELTDEYHAELEKRLLHAGEASGEPSGENGDSGPSNKCALCGHPEWHPKSKNCWFRGIPKSYVKRLIREVDSKKKGQELLKAFKARVDMKKDDKEVIHQAIDEIRNEQDLS